MTKQKARPPHEVLAESLRHLAELMCNTPDNFSVEDGKALDRALRSCKGISDIDRVWVRWGYVAEQRDWLTVKEMIYTGTRYGYKE
jgi:hypothetical protein